LRNGFSVQASYTFSKSIDDVITPSNIYYGNGYDRGLSNFDRTHVFNVSYVYRIPFGAKLAALPRAVLHGWQLSGVSRWIKLKERAQLQIRGEFFNLMYHTQWSSVNTSVGSATLGQVTTARNPRYTQLAARIVF
jgi:hypothetical protein